MSESTSEDFSDSDSDVGQEEQEGPSKVIENKSQESKDEVKGSDDDNNVETDSSDEEEVEQPPKKRKTLQDYLIEKVN